MMLLNQSDEYVRFVGIVRPQDIEQDNTIKSTRVANVHMAYGGQGAARDLIEKILKMQSKWI